MYNNSITFNQIEELKKQLPNQYTDYNSVLKYKFDILKQANQYFDYTQLLKNLMGIYPSDLATFLYANPQYSEIINYTNASSDFHYDTLWCEELSFPAQLANYEWRYTKKSAENIVGIISHYDQIGCLGTPTIALQLICANKASKTILFDINKPVIEKIRKKYSELSGIKCIEYDAVDDIPKIYKNNFDIVTINPPWYYDYYNLFICRSLQMLKSSSKEIILPLFSLLSKHTAISELLRLFELLQSLGCYRIDSLGYIDFEMPLFERKSLKENNIPIPNYNWRNAELVKLSFDSSEESHKCSISISDHIRWETKITKSNKLILLNEACINNAHTIKLKKEIITDISRKSRISENIALWDVDNNTVFRQEK